MQFTICEMDTSFGHKLRVLREAAGLNGVELAQRAGIGDSYLSMLERGKRQIPTLPVLQALAAGLDLGLGEFMRRTGLIEAQEGWKDPLDEELDLMGYSFRRLSEAQRRSLRAFIIAMRAEDEAEETEERERRGRGE